MKGCQIQWSLKPKRFLLLSLFSGVPVCQQDHSLARLSMHSQQTGTVHTQQATQVDKVRSAFSGTHINTSSTQAEMNNTAQFCSPSADDQFTTGLSLTFTLHSQSLLHSWVPRSDRSAQDPCPNPWLHLTDLQFWPCVFPDSGLFQLASQSSLKCASESCPHASTQRARSQKRVRNRAQEDRTDCSDQV